MPPAVSCYHVSTTLKFSANVPALSLALNYDRAVKKVRKEVEAQGAEGVLEMPAKHREPFSLRPLSESSRIDFAGRWRAVQSQFDDEPRGAVAQADHLVKELLETRGFPMADFEQRAADLSVDHPVIVENYRAAHAIALRDSSGQASTQASSEDLRQAMAHYRALFDELLGGSLPARKEARA